MQKNDVKKDFDALHIRSSMWAHEGEEQQPFQRLCVHQAQLQTDTQTLMASADWHAYDASCLRHSLRTLMASADWHAYDASCLKS